MTAHAGDFAYFKMNLLTVACIPVMPYGLPWPPPPSLFTMGLYWVLDSLTNVPDEDAEKDYVVREAMYVPAVMDEIVPITYSDIADDVFVQ